VVIGILLIVMGIAIFFLPDITKWQRASEGASQLQQWLLTAKQRALRERKPIGLRLIVTVDSTQTPAAVQVTDLQYVEQPDDYTGGMITGINGTTVNFAGVDFTNNVQAGDYLEIRGGGPVSRITAVSGSSLTLASSPVVVVPPQTSLYRIIRQPRVLVGEETLQLPQNVAIDLNLSRPSANGAQLQYVDILFSPSGTVIGQLAAYDTIALWVSDTTDTTPNHTDGDHTLIAIYIRTGLIAGYRVDTTNPPTSFYANLQAGLSSGE
jgi:hypothetical protein